MLLGRLCSELSIQPMVALRTAAVVKAFAFFIGCIFIGCGGSGGGSNDAADTAPQPVGEKNGAVVFFGDSLTAGYVIPVEQAYPALIEEKLRAAGHQNRVVNAGISGQTSAEGLARISSVLGQPITIFFLELGANDSRHGVEPVEMKRNLRSTIDAVRAANPQVAIVIAGMVSLGNRGPEYDAAFRQVYSDLAAETGATLMPFLLEDVYGKPEYYPADDDIHPNAKGHQIVAESVYKYIEPLLR